MTRNLTVARLAQVAIFYALVIAGWELLARSGVWSPLLFPAPGSVWDSFWRMTESGLLWDSVRGTLWRLAVGYGLSLGFGVALGAFIGGYRWAEGTVGTVVLGLQSLPSITWLPMAILWFGLSQRAIIFVVFMGSAFSVALAVRDGIRGLPPIYSRVAGTFGASWWQRFLFITTPGMLPSFVAGLKQGWSFAWRSLMAGELLFVTIGLGHLLHIGRELNDISMVFAVMLVIIAIGVAIDRLGFARLEAWVAERWGLARA